MRMLDPAQPAKEVIESLLSQAKGKIVGATLYVDMEHLTPLGKPIDKPPSINVCPVQLNAKDYDCERRTFTRFQAHELAPENRPKLLAEYKAMLGNWQTMTPEVIEQTTARFNTALDTAAQQLVDKYPDPFKHPLSEREAREILVHNLETVSSDSAARAVMESALNQAEVIAIANEQDVARYRANARGVAGVDMFGVTQIILPNDKECLGTVMEEFAHTAIQQTYGNTFLPYASRQDGRRKLFIEALQDIKDWKQLRNDIGMNGYEARVMQEEASAKFLKKYTMRNISPQSYLDYQALRAKYPSMTRYIETVVAPDIALGSGVSKPIFEAADIAAYRANEAAWREQTGAYLVRSGTLPPAGHDATLCDTLRKHDVVEAALHGESNTFTTTIGIRGAQQELASLKKTLAENGIRTELMAVNNQSEVAALIVQGEVKKFYDLVREAGIEPRALRSTELELVVPKGSLITRLANEAVETTWAKRITTEHQARILPTGPEPVMRVSSGSGSGYYGGGGWSDAKSLAARGESRMTQKAEHAMEDAAAHGNRAAQWAIGIAAATVGGWAFWESIRRQSKQKDATITK